MPEGTTLILWGIDGSLAGNEKRLHYCPPAFQAEGHDPIYVARRLQWSFEPFEGLASLAEPEASEKLQRLAPQKLCAVEPGQVVAIMGPIYEAYVRELSIFGVLDIWDEYGWTHAQDNFLVTTLSLSQYQELRGRLYKQAEAVFDREVVRSPYVLTDAARAGLAVVLQTAHGPVKRGIVRKLVALRIDKDPDPYIRARDLGAIQLNVPPEELERVAAEWFRIKTEEYPFSNQPPLRAAESGQREILGHDSPRGPRSIN